MNDWAQNETQASHIKDARLKKRLQSLVSRLSNEPTESIPCATEGWSETLAAYRFLDNDKVDVDGILSGHRQATLARIKAQPVVLAIQDTTFLNFEKQVENKFGTLKKTQSHPYLLHPTVAFTPDRINLGVLGVKFWQRPEKPVAHERSRKPIEEKESVRWLESYALACEVQKQCPETTVVSIADREGDIGEWFMDAQRRCAQEKAEFIVRAKCNRRTEKKADEFSYLWDELAGCKALGSLRFITPRHKNSKPREVELTLKAKAVEFVGRQGSQSPPVSVYAVYGQETHPPGKEKPIEWMLLTSLAVEDLSGAQTIMGWYRSRWEIEIYFKVLKGGCAIEALRLETERRLFNGIAIYLIASWRIHTITMASRCYPEVSCERVFTASEWKTIYVMQKKKKPPQQAPSLNEATRMLAQLGGFLARKGDGEPGVKNIWRGYRRLMDYVSAMALAHKLG